MCGPHPLIRYGGFVVLRTSVKKSGNTHRSVEYVKVFGAARHAVGSIASSGNPRLFPFVYDRISLADFVSIFLFSPLHLRVSDMVLMYKAPIWMVTEKSYINDDRYIRAPQSFLQLL